MKNLRYDKPEQVRVGNVDQIFLSGTGVDRESGVEMEFGLGLYAKNGKLLIILPSLRLSPTTPTRRPLSRSSPLSNKRIRREAGRENAEYAE